MSENVKLIVTSITTLIVGGLCCASIICYFAAHPLRGFGFVEMFYLLMLGGFPLVAIVAGVTFKFTISLLDVFDK